MSNRRLTISVILTQINLFIIVVIGSLFYFMDNHYDTCGLNCWRFYAFITSLFCFMIVIGVFFCRVLKLSKMKD